MQSNELKDKIQQLLADPQYRPSRQSELIKLLKLPSHRQGEVRRVLSQLINEGKIVRVRKDRLVLPAEADLVTGRLIMNERGFGFVVPEDKSSKSGDVFIAAENVGVAMHKDVVVCRIDRPLKARRQQREGAPQKLEGRIIRILNRANETIVGTLQKTNLFHYVVPDEPRIIQDIYVKMPEGRKKDLKAGIGDKVVVQLEPWTSRHVNPEGRIIEVLGRPDDPHIDIICIIRKFRLPTEFPPEVLAEAAAIPDEVPPEEVRNRLDLTRETVFTIDPEDARDYDDAISIRKRDAGGWQIGVHIADVSHYVRQGSALDREARLRGNSVYLPDRVLPMLPEKLSNGLCSLKANVLRLTKSVLFEISAKGNVEKFSFAETAIHSRHRLTYPQALKHLEDPHDHSEIGRLLKETWKAASQIRAHRFAKGSLDLDFPEIKVICDEKGRAIRIEKREYDISHQLIEELMLIANEAVASATKNNDLPSIYRVHEDPDAEKLEEYRDFVLTYGFKIGDITNRKELQRLLSMFRGESEEYVLKLNLLKSLKRAAYEEHPKGHYGLAKEDYTHFTSPIRRYADLVVHRILGHFMSRNTPKKSEIRNPKSEEKNSRFEIRDSKFPYSMGDLGAIADHVSVTERTAAEAEQEAVKLKQIEYFERQTQSRKRDTFNAVITDVRNFGLFIELPDLFLSGLVHISTLQDDFYKFDALKFHIIGKEHGRIYKVGQKVKVQAMKVDRFKRQIDFRLADDQG